MHSQLEVLGYGLFLGGRGRQGSGGRRLEVGVKGEGKGARRMEVGVKAGEGVEGGAAPVCH